MINKIEKNIDDDASDKVEEFYRNIDPDEDDQPYFDLEESKPPHY